MPGYTGWTPPIGWTIFGKKISKNIHQNCTIISSRPQSRVVILAITLIVFIIILIIVCRLLLSLCRCCGCVSKKK